MGRRPKHDTLREIEVIFSLMLSRSSMPVATPERDAEPRIARQVAFSTRQLVWLDSRAERTRSACAPAAGWIQLKGRSQGEMWSDSSGMPSTLHARVG